MKIEPFALERFFDRHEFSARYLLSCSDCEPLDMAELVAMADPDSHGMWDRLNLAYTHTAGHPALRDAIARGYQRIDPENILAVVPEEGIFLLMASLLDPGDHVICTFPGYQSLYELARARGCEVTLWELGEEHGWQSDAEQLQGLLRDTTKLVVVNFPHNPTGFLPDSETFMKIVDLVRGSGAYLFSDEMYRLLEFDPRTRLPAACDLYEKAVSLSGLSKSFGLPGLRMGWLAVQDREVLDRIRRLKDYTTICSSAPSEILAIMALRARDRILALQRARISRNLETLDTFMQNHTDHFLWHRPRAGSICFPRMVSVDDTQAFCENLVRQAGIMLVPSSLFGFGRHHVRLGFGRENFPRILDRFGDYLARQFSRKRTQ